MSAIRFLKGEELYNKFLNTEDHNDLSTSHTDIYKYFQGQLSTIDDDFSVKKLFENFYEIFYNNGYDYDISGYSLIFFYPPHLSGIDGSSPETLFKSKFLDFMTLCLEFNPLDASVTKQSVNVGGSTFDFPTRISRSGDVSLTFLDTHQLKLYKFHLAWLQYIKDVIRGDIDPATEYIDTHTIDYVGSIYSIKYDVDMETPILVSKAMGIYPNGIGGKELFGNRAQQQLSMINMSYNCMLYIEEPCDNSSEGLYGEFVSLIEKAYS